MKIILLMMISLLAVMTVSAQVYITPEIGVAMLKRDYMAATVSPRVGVGLDFYFKKSKGLGISTGLYFYQKKDLWRDAAVYLQNGEYLPLYSPYGPIDKSEVKRFDFIESDVKRNYLHLPVLLTYTWKFSDNSSLSLGIGPYVAYGIAGKFVWSSREYDLEGKEFSFSEKEFNPFDSQSYHHCDVGLTSMLSLNINRWLVKMNYETNLNRRDLSEDNLISLGIGYRFSL